MMDVNQFGETPFLYPQQMLCYECDIETISETKLQLAVKRTDFFGESIWNGGRQKCPLLFSKIINAVTFKLSTKVAHLKYFKKMWWKY